MKDHLKIPNKESPIDVKGTPRMPSSNRKVGSSPVPASLGTPSIMPKKAI